MSKQSNKGGGNMLLLAGLGVGALLLFGNKSVAQTLPAFSSTSEGEEAANIPEAPKILAVNSSSTESPTPTGIVSDEEGMEIASSQSTGTGAGSGVQPETKDGDDYGDDDIPAANSTRTTGPKPPVKAAPGKRIPAIVSTPLTPKEKAIINSGKLTATLAMKRPDLYKAAYVKKHGGKTAAGKRKALIAATLAIDAAVKAAQATKQGAAVKAVRYPAKPQFTFVQAAGGMLPQTTLAKIAALQKAGVTPSPAAQKVAAQVTAAKAGKGRFKGKSGQPVPVRATKPAATLSKKRKPTKRR